MGGEIVNLVPDSARSASDWVVATLGCCAVISAIVAITRRTSLATALAMVATSLSLAGLYASLTWHFLGAVQIMLWGGSLLAFFVFNVISLNRDDTDPVALRGIVTRTAALCASLFLLLFIARDMMRAAWPSLLGGRPNGLQENPTTALAQSLFGELGFPMQMLALGLLMVVLASLALTRVATSERG